MIRRELPLVIYLFLLFFAPPVIKGVNFLLPLSIFSIIVIVLKYRKNLKLTIKNPYLKQAVLLIVVYYIWQIFVILANGLMTDWHFYNYAINFYSMFLVFPISFVCCLHIVFYAQEKKICFDELIKIMIYAGLLQSICTLLAFLFPSVKDLFLKIMYENTGEKLYLNSYHTTRRFFGFANNLLDSFGFGTGILAVLPLFYSIKNGKKWLLTVPFLLLVPILNSRTGLLLFGIGFIVWFIYIIRANLFRDYYKSFLCAFLIIVILFILIYIFYPYTIEWIVTDVLSFFTNRFGTADTLFGSDFWTLPHFWNIIFGCGYVVAAFGGLKNELGFTSDVGYINEIWKTGIVGMLLMVILFIFIIRFLWKNIKNSYRYFVIFLLVAVFISHIKFYVYGYNPGIIVILLLFCYLALTKVKENRPVLEKQDLISIIIPIYNVEKYLSRCLDSVIRQTYKNIEIILVNDGSTDDSGVICEKYQKKDSRIHYIKQENGGLSAARNTGMKNAHGEYFIFIDSDDYVNVHFVEELYSASMNTNADMAVCNYKIVYEQKVDIFKQETSLLEVVEENKFDNLYNKRSTVTTVAWNKLYKKELFDKIKYPDGKLHEDEYVIPYLLEKVKRITYTNCKYYYYYQRPNSITGSYGMKRLDILKALKDRVKFFKEKQNKRLEARALYNYYYQLLYQKNMMLKYFPKEKKMIKKMEMRRKKIEKEFFCNIYINPLRKIKILFKFYINTNR